MRNLEHVELCTLTYIIGAFIYNSKLSTNKFAITILIIKIVMANSNVLHGFTAYDNTTIHYFSLFLIT